MNELQFNSTTLLVVGALSTLAVFGLALVATRSKMIPVSANLDGTEIKEPLHDLPSLKRTDGLGLIVQTPSHLESQDYAPPLTTLSTTAAHRTPTIAYDLSVSPGKQVNFPSVRKASMANQLLNDIEKENYLKSQKSDLDEDTYVPPAGLKSKKSGAAFQSNETPTMPRKKSRIDMITSALGEKGKKSTENLTKPPSIDLLKKSNSTMKLEKLNTDLPSQNSDDDDDVEHDKSPLKSAKALKVLGELGLDIPGQLPPKTASLTKIKSPAHSHSSSNHEFSDELDANTPSKALKIFGEDPKTSPLDRCIISTPLNFVHIEHIPENIRIQPSKHEAYLNPTNDEHRSDEVTGDRKPVTPLGDYGFNCNSFAIALSQASATDAAHAIGKLKISQAVNTLQCMSPEKVSSIIDRIPLSDFKTDLLRELSMPPSATSSTTSNIPAKVFSSSSASISKPIGAPVKRKDGFNPTSLALVLDSLPTATAISTLQNVTPSQAAETLNKLSAEKRLVLLQQLPANGFKAEMVAALESGISLQQRPAFPSQASSSSVSDSDAFQPTLIAPSVLKGASDEDDRAKAKQKIIWGFDQAVAFDLDFSLGFDKNEKDQ